MFTVQVGSTWSDPILLDQRSKAILKDGRDVAAGEKLAVFGLSGSGKTCFMMAMMQRIDIRGGRAVINDTDVATLDGESMRSHLDVVSQEPLFMRRSLGFNLKTRSIASDASIGAMLRRVSAGLWDKLAASSNGSLHENSGHLSGLIDSRSYFA